MNQLRISRRSFTRLLAGLFSFAPVARSLTAFAADNDDIAFRQLQPQLPDPSRIITSDELKAMLKTRIAKGKVLALRDDSIWISDSQVDELRLVITDESIVWKGKYNKGKNFDSYPHTIEPGDAVIALGQRGGDNFIVEKMYANILNTYVTVDEISLDQDEVILSYTDASEKKCTVKIRPDYLINKALYEEIVGKHHQLRGTVAQIIGLPLKDDAIVAANVFIST